MSAEAVAAAAAVVTVTLTILGALVVLIYNAGRHSQRLDSAEKSISVLQDGAHEAGRLDTALQVLTGTVNTMQKQLVDVSHDVKNLLTGRVVPARQRHDPTD